MWRSSHQQISEWSKPKIKVDFSTICTIFQKFIFKSKEIYRSLLELTFLFVHSNVHLSRTISLPTVTLIMLYFFLSLYAFVHMGAMSTLSSGHKKIFHFGITKVFPFLVIKVSSYVEILASANIKVKSTQNCCRFLHYVYNISENYFRIEESIPLTRRTNLFLHSQHLSTL